MFVQATCANCKQIIKADEKYFGKTVKCPHCKAHLTIPDPRAQQPDPLVGKPLAHYMIEALLGHGAMGRVYRAKNLKLDKTCAIKILPEDFAKKDQSLIDRFVREAQSAANVEHPNVLPVHYVGKQEDTYFIEMQYVDGGTVEGLLQERGRLDPKEAARIVRDVAAGLGAAHAKGIIHRDIKPANVMLTKQGEVKVADFGLARLVEASTKFTLSGLILGTPLYMSPEQGEGKPADHRSDIYSLGAMFYRVLTGSPPYIADNLFALLGMHANAPAPDVRAVAPDVPEVLSAIIMRMMAKKPEERYQSCAEIADDLNGFLASLTSPDKPVGISDSTLEKMAELRERRVAGLAGDRARKKKSIAPLLVGVIPTLIVVGVLAFVLVPKWKKPMGEKKGVATEVTEKKEEEETTKVTKGEEKEVATDEHGLARIEQKKPESIPLQAGQKTQEEPPQLQIENRKLQIEKPSAPSVVSVAKIDLVSFLDAIKPVDERIENYDYSAARGRANLLKTKYPDLIEAKLANLDRIEALRKRCFVRINTGAVKLNMGDISRRYAFAGEIKHADEKGLTATIKKTWDSFERDEITEFYRKACDPNSAEDHLGIACFLMEGQADEKRIESALDALGKAAGLGGDVQPLLAYVETLKQARREYAEAEEKGKAMETAEGTAKDAKDTKKEEEGEKKEEKEGEKPLGDLGVLAVDKYDGVYVTTAATGDKIPHPLSRKTEEIIYQGKRIDVPEGMVYVPAGPFLMGEGTEPPEGPQHEVYLDAYFIGKYEVTNAEYMEFVKATGHSMPEHWVKNGNKIPEGRENHPAAYMSWEDAKAYCDWVKENTGWEVRLPTEAEWEKAASWNPKKNMKTVYPWGNSWDSKLCNSGWMVGKYGFRPNDEGKDWQKKWVEWEKSEKGKEIIAAGGNTMGVGSFKRVQTFYGCYDTVGNLDEWCQDWFRTDYYLLKDAKRNPQGPSEEEAEEVQEGNRMIGKCRPLRGGCWYSISGRCRVTYRIRHSPSSRYNYFGFRVALSPRSIASPADRETKPSDPSQIQNQPSKTQNYDDAYVVKAATGDKIPHPLSRKTEKVIVQGKRIDVPEGMVYVPAGPFLMGEGTAPPEGPQHEVYLDAYLIGKYEVTNAEWKEFVDATGFTPPQYWVGGKIPEGKENHPVVYVSWDDAQKYCEWVNQCAGARLGEFAGWQVRLPTEAEWEKAASWSAQKNMKTVYAWGNTFDPRLCNCLWHIMTKCGLRPSADWSNWSPMRVQAEKTEKWKQLVAAGGYTMAVGSFKRVQCAYGCYDTVGNVYEWCADWFKTDYHLLKDAMKNPQGPSEAEAEAEAEAKDFSGVKKKARLLRGGAWNSSYGCRATGRFWCYPSNRDHAYGVRVVLSFRR